MKIVISANHNHTCAILTWPNKFSSVGYHVYRKLQSPSSTLTKLTSTPLLVNFYEDTTIQKTSRYIYKITYLDTSNVEHDLTEETYDNVSPGRIALGNVFSVVKEITYRSFSLGKAERCIILIKPFVGVRCPDCYNTETQDLAGSNYWCSTCQNTKITGGYIKFPNMLTRFGNFGSRMETTEVGYELREAVQGQLLDYPLVRAEDIIVRPTGERHFITGDVRKIQVQSLLVKQTFNLREVMAETPFYEI